MELVPALLQLCLARGSQQLSSTALQLLLLPRLMCRLSTAGVVEEGGEEAEEDLGEECSVVLAAFGVPQPLITALVSGFALNPRV